MLLDKEANKATEHTLRELAAIVDSEFYRPFFTHMSYCIEGILQHSLGYDEIDGEFTRASADTVFLAALLQQSPCKRVAFSALPYKQLYKDPAVLVRVGDGPDGKLKGGNSAKGTDKNRPVVPPQKPRTVTPSVVPINIRDVNRQEAFRAGNLVVILRRLTLDPPRVD